jgi:hypothetical protein
MPLSAIAQCAEVAKTKTLKTVASFLTLICIVFSFGLAFC